MSDPLSLVTLAVAAAGGRWDGHEVGPLIAAGHTLLQRSAVLVRALASARSAILMPPGSAVLTALAASDGHGALLLDPGAHAADLPRLLEQHQVGVLFVCGTPIAPALARVVVDLTGSPTRATVYSDGAERLIDLGSHFGLDLIGDTATEGRDEPFVAMDGVWWTHRRVLAAARALAEREGLTPMHHVAAPSEWTTEGLVRVVAVMLNGGTVHSSSPPPFTPFLLGT